MLEQVNIFIFLLLLAGTIKPTLTAWIGVFHAFGRIVYAIGYTSSPNGRVLGAMCVMLSMVSLFSLSGYALYWMIIEIVLV
jgi:hypothetical protein